jgi:5-deoxy-glucuronate isomerase
VTEVATGLYRPAGSLAADGWSVVLTPESAGWSFSGLRVGALEPGDSLEFDTGADEVAVLPL